MNRNTNFIKTTNRLETKHHISAPYRPNKNTTEVFIQQIKVQWHWIMVKKTVLKNLWGCGLVWICDIGELYISSSKCTKVRTVIEIITGKTPDISEYLDIIFYDWVTYRRNDGLGDISLCIWIGLYHKVGKVISYCISTDTGYVISATTFPILNNSKIQKKYYRRILINYDSKVEAIIDICWYGYNRIELNTRTE